MKPAILVLGADGAIGRGVVRAAVDAGWPVVAVAQDALALGELCREHRGATLRTLTGAATDEGAAERMVAALRKLPHPFLGAIVAMEPTRQRGRLLDAPAARLRTILDETVVPQLVAARHLLPWLASTGRNCGYVVVGGPGSRHPWAGYAHRSVAAAALSMLARALHDEAVSHAVRLQLLDVDSPLRIDGGTAVVSGGGASQSRERWPTAFDIGRRAIALLEHRNDARCTRAVVGYQEAACFFAGAEARAAGHPAPEVAGLSGAGRHCDQDAIDAGDVESRVAHSSEPEKGATPDRQPPPDDLAQARSFPDPAHESDGAASGVTPRWADDVRRLLATLSLPKNKQERSP